MHETLTCAGFVVVLAACGATPVRVALAPSLLPNLGLAASLAVPLAERSAWHYELRFTDQFLDDKDFADNDLPSAGNWTQLDLGLAWWGAGERRRWSARVGWVGFEARGEPNLADEAGDYWGLYVGGGRWLELGGGWSLGPELTLIAASGPDPVVLIPQLTWGLAYGARGP